jgi:hypothetical protein
LTIATQVDDDRCYYPLNPTRGDVDAATLEAWAARPLGPHTTWRGAIPFQVAEGGQIRVNADGGLAPLFAASAGFLHERNTTELS